MWLLIGFVVVITVLCVILSRRGSSGMTVNGSTDTVEGAMGQMSHNYGADRSGGGGGFGG